MHLSVVSFFVHALEREKVLLGPLSRLQSHVPDTLYTYHHVFVSRGVRVQIEGFTFLFRGTSTLNDYELARLRMYETDELDYSHQPLYYQNGSETSAPMGRGSLRSG